MNFYWKVESILKRSVSLRNFTKVEEFKWLIVNYFEPTDLTHEFDEIWRLDPMNYAQICNFLHDKCSTI